MTEGPDRRAIRLGGGDKLAKAMNRYGKAYGGQSGGTSRGLGKLGPHGGSGVRVEWKGPKVLRQLEAGMGRKLDQAAELLRSQVVRALRKNQSTSGRGKSLATHRSKPGEIPYVDSGHLSKSIFWRRSGKLTRQVGTPVLYGLFLQIGTRFMKPRPWLDVILKQNQSKIKAILTRKTQR